MVYTVAMYYQSWVWRTQDKKKQTVVNNDSGQIMEMLNSDFDEISQDLSCPDLFPKELQAEITELNEYMADSINTGVYKCGFAESQVCYHV
jgi:putative glutathione S-transferase